MLLAEAARRGARAAHRDASARSTPGTSSASSSRHDNYYSTHSDENRDSAELIYHTSERARPDLHREVEQLYDPERKLFLADRFVKGECPRCGAADQYGDNCEVCSARPTTPPDLNNPYSTLSGATPVLAELAALFLRSAPVTPISCSRLDRPAAPCSREVANKLKEWLDAGLKPWDICRDAPYFGFLIPGTRTSIFTSGWTRRSATWRVSRTIAFARRRHLRRFLGSPTPTRHEVHHFIGKDIVNFHALFWPAVLEGSRASASRREFTRTDSSRWTAPRCRSRAARSSTPRTYLNHLDPEYLRYYFAAKSNGTVDDIDINLDDFVQRVNSDLVGKIVNIASRCAGFITRQFDGHLADSLHDEALWRRFVEARHTIAEHFEASNTARAVREITALADLANQYVATHAPWALAKDPDKRDEVQGVCSRGSICFACWRSI